MAGTGVDIFVAYKFIKQLSKPWKDWEAYKLGLIDNKGHRLKKAETKEEKKAYPLWKVLVRNMKRLLDRLPGGTTKMGSFAVALWMLKEEMNVEDVAVLEKELQDYVDSHLIFVLAEDSSKKINTLEEGRYIHLPTGNAIFVKQQIDAVGEVFNVPVFEVTDWLSGKQYITQLEELEKF